MGDGLLIIRLTSFRQQRNLINTLYRHHRTYRWQQVGLWCLQTGMIQVYSRHPVTPTLPEHYWSTNMDSVNTEVWCGLSYFRTVTVHDKTHRETCQNGIQSYELPSGHTPLNIWYKTPDIPWIKKQDLHCVWCSLHNRGWTCSKTTVLRSWYVQTTWVRGTQEPNI